MSDYNKQYPDTVEGCKQFLKEQTCLKLTKQSTFQIDEMVQGVWCIHNVDYPMGKHTERGDVVIYLKGYKEPFGNIREYNDFEFCEKAVHRPL